MKEGGKAMKGQTWSFLISIVAMVCLTGTSYAAASKDEVCSNLNELDTAVNNMARIGPQSTVGELKQAQNQVSESYDKFMDSAKSYAKPQAENLEKMIGELEKSAKDIPDDETLAQAQATLQDDVTQVRMAADQLGQKLDCGNMQAKMPPSPESPQ